MGLTDLWQTSRGMVEGKHVAQVIAFAGEGRLRDQGSASDEFRAFLGQVSTSMLARYAEECLADRFADSGLALQDVVNEVGRRLGFAVRDGRYRGVPNEIGFDGLWRAPDGHAIVVESKTSDTYRIELSKLDGYRRGLIEAGTIAEGASSILLIVGRQSTEDIEAQIRGSRHAWDMRMISVDALLRLMHLRASMDDPAIVRRICAILIPREFTRLDEIVDVIFSAAEEVRPLEVRPELEVVVAAPALEASAAEGEAGPEAASGRGAEASAADAEVAQTVEAWPGLQRGHAPLAFHAAVIAQVEHHLGRSLLKRSKTGYSSPDHGVAVACLISRPHFRASHVEFWFAFHPHQRDFLQTVDDGYVALGCGTESYILLIPLEEFEPWLGPCSPRRDGRSYWHVRIHATEEGFTLHVGGVAPEVDMTQHLLPLWGWM